MMRTTKHGLLALLLSAASLSAAPGVDADWILAKLARPAPTRTSFVELRGSRLLKTPLRIEGEYQRPDDHTLVREVRAPYSETTTIVSGKAGAGEVTIARPGKPPRTFSLARAPELVGLQASFGALLAGDRVMLERHYHLATQGTRQQWMLALAPKDPALAAKVRTITLYGRGAELRCIETESAKAGDMQRTLLASAARTVSDADALAVSCRNP